MLALFTIFVFIEALSRDWRTVANPKIIMKITIKKKGSYILCLKDFAKGIMQSLLSFFIMFTAPAQAGSDPFEETVKTLHAKGYTGKNVRIGVIDDFDGEKSHGGAVCALIKKVAPDAQIVTHAVKKPAKKTLKKHQTINSISQRVFEDAGDHEKTLTIKARTPSTLYVLEETSKKRHAIDIMLSLKGARTYLTCLSLERNESVTVKKVSGWRELYQLNLYDRSYYVLFEDLKKQDLVVPMAPCMLEKITPGKTALTPLKTFIDQGVKIVNLSLTRSWHQESIDDFEAFARAGGVLIKAAGNTPISLGVSDIPLGYWESTFASDVRELLQNTIAGKLLDSPHTKSCLFVGAVNKTHTIESYSARAGLFKKQYVTAPLEGKAEGTSFAAPGVTGLLALLQEAYPDGVPSALLKIIRKTSKPLSDDPEGEMGGKGVVQPLAAMKEVERLSLVALKNRENNNSEPSV